ncbi:MAG TPA: response regulator transcription factor [Mycobacteriales bacterium]|nr:response regulator transcription factor [Mycobacteriales bacterium]
MSDSNGSEPVTVFLLDDHEVVRDGLRALLEAAGLKVVGEASTAAEALRRIPATRPRVAVLDVELPDGDGVSVCRDIRASLPDTQVLMLTSHDDDEALFASIMAGASGYVLKQVRGNDLVDGVRRVAEGQSLLDPSVTAAVLERLRRGPQEDERLAGLTDQERKVLELVADGLTNRQIGTKMHLAEKTVKNYVSSVLAKLGLASRTQAAVFVATEVRR